MKHSNLWRHQDFIRLWAGQTISVLGSMVGFFAMSLVAIQVLHATPVQLAVLGVARLLPGFLISLVAGAWVDRVRRRPILVAADLGRALILSTIPLAAFMGVLQMGQLYLVVFLVSMLTTLFDVAYESYLPSLVRKEELIESNSKLSSSASISEIAGFSIAGWLIQFFSVSAGILIDAISFLFSAFFIARIKSKEALVEPESRDVYSEIAAGLRELWASPNLRASAICTLILELSFGINSVLIVLYMTKGLGFQPGILGMIWALGGISSLVAAVFAAGISRRLGIGPVMVLGLLFSGVGMMLIPLAKGATLLSILLLIASQLVGDGAMMFYRVNKITLQQSVAPADMMGRVNAGMQFVGIGAMLAGSVLGGVMGETLGVRTTLFIGGGGILCAMLWLFLSPVKSVQQIPASSYNAVD